MSALHAVDLPRLLAELRLLPDLPGLAAWLGADPLWQPIDPPPALSAAALIARQGDMPWFGGSAAEVRGAMRSWAARLERQGQRAVLMVLAPDARELAVGVAGAPAPLVLRCERPDAVVLAALARLRLAVLGPARHFERRALDALDGREAGAAFFRQFRTTLTDVAAALPGSMTPADRRALALVQLTRVLFLYFIQQKGWLDGRTGFLADAVDRALLSGRGVQASLLNPLFFGALARPAPERSATVRRLGAIPWLNGGLFEPHALERRHRVVIPDACWRRAFDELFERFHFTVPEGGDAGGVAPDMLGRVFEGAMEPDDRRRAGAFYTPSALVHQVLDAALATLLGTRLGLPAPEAAGLMAARADVARRELRRVRVLDPACGSGAFLLGALEQLAALTGTSAERPVQVRARVLRENLFGVDVDPMAVRLTELRLWLALVSHDDCMRPELVRPLPNLDGNIRQGDSLAEPAFIEAGAAHAAQLRALRTALATAHGAAHRRAGAELRRAEQAAALDALQRAERVAHGRIREVLAAARAPTLFGGAAPMPRELRAELRKLRAERVAVRRARRQLERDGRVPWFSYAAAFGEVMAAGGFDLVAGNPPWVRAESLPPRMRALLAERYRWWRPAAGAGFRHLPDASVAFVERSLELAAPDGVVALLVPEKLATADYARVMRGALPVAGTVHILAPLPEHAASFGATTYPMALVVGRGDGWHDGTVATSLDGERRMPRAALGEGPWILRQRDTRGLVAALAAAHPPLHERWRCMLGVKTGANDVFIDAEVEDDLRRPLLRGRDIHEFRATTRHHLLWAHGADGAPLPALPPRAAAWIERHRHRLAARADGDGAPPWAVFRVRAGLGRSRVAWPDLARELLAAPLVGRGRAVVPLNSCYVTHCRSDREALALSAWLNSAPIRAVARATATPASGGFIRCSAGVVGALPVPADVVADEALGALASEAISGLEVGAALAARAAELLGLGRHDAPALAATG